MFLKWSNLPMQVFPQSQRTAICKEEQGFFFFGFFLVKLEPHTETHLFLLRLTGLKQEAVF